MQSYVYSYPHKLAYRELEPPVELGPVWAEESHRPLFLYWHIPFCEMRCGFCNLFTSVEHDDEKMRLYLNALERQAQQMRALLPSSLAIAARAIGGGTPTQLPLDALERLLQINAQWGHSHAAPFSVETSPATATPERLALLRQAGVERISMGVQSFLEAETTAIHRAQPVQLVETALAAIRAEGFTRLNLDLMIGLPGQTAASLRESVTMALRWQPEELYVYPLYVRPLTRLYRDQPSCEDDKLYFVARDQLLEAGYEQTSLRMYRRRGAPRFDLEYRCQRDGMLGLGCGARSYTRELHYSTPYAVGSQAVGRILRAYLECPDFRQATFGYRLNSQEQRRRFAVLSLLSEEGLRACEYQQRFGSSAGSDFPQLSELKERGWLVQDAGEWRLTESGKAAADLIGPLFFSPEVRTALTQGASQ